MCVENLIARKKTKLTSSSSSGCHNPQMNNERMSHTEIQTWVIAFFCAFASSRDFCFLFSFLLFFWMFFSSFPENENWKIRISKGFFLYLGTISVSFFLCDLISHSFFLEQSCQRRLPVVFFPFLSLLSSLYCFLTFFESIFHDRKCDCFLLLKKFLGWSVSSAFVVEENEEREGEGKCFSCWKIAEEVCFNFQESFDGHAWVVRLFTHSL